MISKLQVGRDSDHLRSFFKMFLENYLKQRLNFHPFLGYLRHASGKGLTNICRACAPGFAQAAAASTACEPCDAGHFQEDDGDG